MTSSIPQNPSATINSIGEVAFNNEKRCKVLCKELLKNTPIEEINGILSRTMQANESSDKQIINSKIGALKVYQEILKNDTNPSTLTKASEAASNVFGSENNDLQKTRLELFEQLFTSSAGFLHASKLIQDALDGNKIDPFIIQLTTLLVHYNLITPSVLYEDLHMGIEVFDRSTGFEVTDMRSYLSTDPLKHKSMYRYKDNYKAPFSDLPRLEARVLIPLFEVLAEKDKEEIKERFISTIITLAADMRGNYKTEVDSDLKEKILSFIEAAIKKDLYVDEIYDVAKSLFLITCSSYNTLQDEMRYPSEILNVFANLNTKRNEISEMLKEAKEKVDAVSLNDETLIKQKLDYITNLENLTKPTAQSTKSARTRI